MMIPQLTMAVVSTCRGEPSGKMIQIADGKINAYLATPPAGKEKTGKAILYVADIFGMWTNSKLLVDQFAANGYTCLMPDLFNGDKLPEPMPADFDIMGWITKGTGGENPHTAEAVDPVVVAGIEALKGMGATKIGAVGYCFGAKVS